jgi:hypothetical protein
LIDSTFDPCQFSLDRTFKRRNYENKLEGRERKYRKEDEEEKRGGTKQ